MQAAMLLAQGSTLDNDGSSEAAVCDACQVDQEEDKSGLRKGFECENGSLYCAECNAPALVIASDGATCSAPALVIAGDEAVCLAPALLIGASHSSCGASGSRFHFGQWWQL